jgi:CII-binding regulator of phage lambda lysogenization HflD
MDSLRNEIDELRQLDKQCKNIRNLQQNIEQAEQAIQQYRIKSDDLSGNLLSLYEEDTENQQ